MYCKRVALLSTLLINLVVTEPSVRSQAPSRLSVYVLGQSDDMIGTTYTYSIREALRRSNGYALADTQQDAKLVLHVVTLDPECNGKNLQTVAAVSLTANTGPWGTLINQWVLQVPRRQSDSMAQDLVAQLDQTIQTIRAAVGR
jgi:hypothetical protein